MVAPDGIEIADLGVGDALAPSPSAPIPSSFEPEPEGSMVTLLGGEFPDNANPERTVQVGGVTLTIRITEN